MAKGNPEEKNARPFQASRIIVSGFSEAIAALRTSWLSKGIFVVLNEISRPIPDSGYSRKLPGLYSSLGRSISDSDNW